MSTENSEILIIAGEVSGDLIGASLIRELKEINDKIKVFGIGGNKMKAEGFEVSYHIDQLAFLGFAEVVKHIPFIKKVQRTLLELVEQRKIKLAVLIDYPGFNLSIAKKLKAKGIKIIYYVSPQIWAWGKNRIDKMKSLVDKMLVVFPFEKEFYNDSNIDVEFVGHPLVERVNQYNFLSKEEFYSKFGLENNKELLLIMPGSRNQEIKKIFPQCIKAAERLAEKFDLQIVVACSENMDNNVFNDFEISASFKVVKGYNYDLMKLAKFGIIKSGTSTLEAGYFSLPMVIVYRTSFLSYMIGKQLITLDRIGMVNILLGEKFVPELIQNDVNENKIFLESEKILTDKKVYEDYKKGLSVVKEKLGKTGASKKAAGIICELINEEI
jgi:lipid-A-disaccharide synthase